MMRSLLFSLLALLILSSELIAQKVVPPTPQVASLAKYGDIPISLSTGQLNFSIPIHTVNLSDYSMPISLDYSNNGLRPDEYPSWVGHGWTLRAGGVITRQVRGVEDESEFGYNGLRNYGNVVQDYLNNNLTSSEVDAFHLETQQGYKDTAPDMFTFSFPGFSGKLFFDDEATISSNSTTAIKKAICIPRTNLSVTAEFDYYKIYNQKKGSINKFTIMDANGVTYTFKPLEEPSDDLEPGDPDRDSFVNSWHLTEIKTPNNQKILFNYTSRNLDLPEFLSQSKNIAIHNVLDATDKPGSATNTITSRSTSREAILQSISHPSGIIQFVEGEIRNDWDIDYPGTLGQKPRTLEKIQIKSYSGQEIKSYIFDYDNNNSRLFLDAVTEQVNGANSKPPYQFEYQAKSSAPGFSTTNFSKDYWGYYNGKNNSTLLPSYIGTGYAVYRKEITDTNAISFDGADKRPDEHKLKTGVLTKVVYPTGGYSKFSYEMNDFIADLSSIPFYILNGKERVANTKATTNEVDYHSFTLPSAQEVTLKYILETKCLGAEAEVSIINSIGSNEYFRLIRSTKDQPYNYKSRAKKVPLSKGTYLLRTIADIEHCQTNKATASVLAYPPQPTGEGKIEGGGLRISKVEDCTGTNDCITTTYNYEDQSNPGQSSGKLVNAPKYSIRKQFILGLEGSWTDEYTADYEVLSSSSSIPIATSQGSYVSYKNVTVAKGENGELGSTRYTFSSAHNFPNLEYFVSPQTPIIDMSWKRGKVLESTIFDNNHNELIQESYDYNLGGDNIDYYNKLLGVSLYEKVTSYKVDPPQPWEYLVEKYRIKSAFDPIRSSIHKKFELISGIQQSLTTTRNILQVDDKNHQPLEEEIIHPDGSVKKFNYYYPTNYAAIGNLSTEASNGYSLLNSNRRWLEAIQTEEYNNSQLVKKTRKTYAYFGSRLLTKNVFDAQGNEPFEKEVEFLDYSSTGNIISYRQGAEGTDNLKKSYKWGYNGLVPVCEIIGADVADVIYTSFEYNGNTSVAKTGSLGYVGPASYSISEPRILTYWKKPVSGGPWQYVEQEISGNITIGNSSTIIDEVRIFPKGAMLSTYTYDHALRITSVTDNNNKTDYYFYDNAGRLETVKDDKQHVLKNYRYKYSSDQ